RCRWVGRRLDPPACASLVGSIHSTGRRALGQQKGRRKWPRKKTGAPPCRARMGTPVSVEDAALVGGLRPAGHRGTSRGQRDERTRNSRRGKQDGFGEGTKPSGLGDASSPLGRPLHLARNIGHEPEPVKLVLAIFRGRPFP